MAKVKGPHHRGTFHVQGRHVRQSAYANPATKCWRCGLTLADYAKQHGTQAARWTAGHVRDGEVGGVLLPEHFRCNVQAGNRARNPTSEDW
jgi:hypothetical protein